MKRLTRFASIIFIFIVMGSFVSTQMPIVKPFYIRVVDLVDVPATKYMIIPAGSFRRGSSAPTQSVEGTFATLLFAQNATHDIYYNLHIPADWEVGTDIELAIYWAPTDANSGLVAWEFDWEAVASEADEVLGAGSTHVTIHDSTQSRDNELLETPYGVISGASIAVDDTIGILLYRDHDDASDNYGTNAALIHVEIEYSVDKLGEVE